MRAPLTNDRGMNPRSTETAKDGMASTETGVGRLTAGTRCRLGRPGGGGRPEGPEVAEVLVADVQPDESKVVLEAVGGDFPGEAGPAVLFAVLDGEPWCFEGEVEPSGAGRVLLAVRAITRLEQRKEVRVAIPGARVTLRGEGLYLDCPVLNLSAGGLQIRHGQDLPAGTRVGMLLRVPLLPPLEASGRVVWTHRERFGLARSGIVLDDDLPAGVRRDLRQICQFYALLAGHGRQGEGGGRP